MKQLKRLKNMLTGEEDSEGQKKTEKQQQSGSEIKTEESKPSEAQKDTSEKPAQTAPEKEASKAEKTDETVKKAPETEDKSAETEDKAEAKKPEKPVEESEKPTESKELKKPQTKRSDSMTLLNGRDAETLTRSDITDDFKQAVIDAGAESVSICFQCGTCTGACPSGRRTPYRVRQLVRRSLVGFKEELMADDTIWMCSTCYECQERCPRGIKIVDIVKVVRNYASQAGHMAQAHKMTGSFVLKTGHGVPINDATKALRKSVGLTELPPTTHEFPEALEEVQTILKTTKFDSLIGYNWETGELE